MSSSLSGPSLSVVVPTYNRSPLLRRTLTSLLEQRGAPPFEVVVVDDGSTDDSEKVVIDFADRLEVHYRYQEDQGYRVATARNAGAAVARAQVLVFLDSGTLAGPDLLAGHLRRHERFRQGVHAPAAGPAVVGYTYGYRPYHPTPGLAEALARMNARQVHEHYLADPSFRDWRHEELVKHDFDLSGLALPWLFFWSMNISVSAADFAAVGGFDEGFRSWGTEDLELGYRLHRRGVPLVADRTCWAVESLHHRDLAANIASGKRNALRFLRTHADPAVELYWALLMRDVMWPAEDAYRDLRAWAEQIRAVDVQPEIDRATADLPAGARVVVLGSGSAVPGGELHGTLIDFDEGLLRAATPGSRFTTHHGIGIRIPCADRSAERVVVTSRLARLWPEWGQAIRQEAGRVASSVRGPLLDDRTPASN